MRRITLDHDEYLAMLYQVGELLASRDQENAIARNLERVNDNLRESYNDLSEEHARLEKELGKALFEWSLLDQDHSAAMQRAEKAEQKNRELTAENNRLRKSWKEDTQRLAEKADAIAQERDEAKSLLKLAQQERNSLYDDVGRKQDAHHDQMVRAEKAEHSLRALQAEIERLQWEKDKLYSAIMRQTDDVRHYSQRGEIERLQRENEDLLLTIEQQERNADTLDQENAELHERIITLEERLDL